MPGSRGNFHGRFIWYQLLTSDVEAAEAFYTDVVGWGTRDASAPGMPYTLFTAADASVAGLMALAEDARRMGARPSWMGYVGVEDVDAMADRVQRLGGIVHVPPMDIPDVSRFSIVSDPQMATFALFKGFRAAQELPVDPRTPGRIGWHELFAADWETAWTFYRELFGWQQAQTDSGAMGPYQLFDVGGETIGGMFTKPATMPTPFWLYYFNVADIDLAMRRVEAGRGDILNGPIEVPGERWILQCADPQGAMFALVGKRSHDGIGYFERVPRQPWRQSQK